MGLFKCHFLSLILISLSYSHSSGLIQEMQNYLDAKHPFICVDSDGDNSGNESNGSADDGFFLEKTNCNFNRAEEEFNNFESFKHNRYHPKWVRDKLEILSGVRWNGELEEIIVGQVQGNGKDLPSGIFFGNYVNEKGRMDVLQFLRITRKSVPPCGSY